MLVLSGEVDTISIIIKTSGIVTIAYIDTAVGSPCVVPSEDGISVPPIKITVMVGCNNFLHMWHWGADNANAM